MKGGRYNTLTNQPNDICNNYVVKGFQLATHSKIVINSKTSTTVRTQESMIAKFEFNLRT